MTGGWFLSHTSECIHPRFSPCTWGGIGSGAGDVEGKGHKRELCSMSQNGDGVLTVKCVGVGEAITRQCHTTIRWSMSVGERERKEIVSVHICMWS